MPVTNISNATDTRVHDNGIYSGGEMRDNLTSFLILNNIYVCNEYAYVCESIGCISRKINTGYHTAVAAIQNAKICRIEQSVSLCRYRECCLLPIR